MNIKNAVVYPMQQHLYWKMIKGKCDFSHLPFLNYAISAMS